MQHIMRGLFVSKFLGLLLGTLPLWLSACGSEGQDLAPKVAVVTPAAIAEIDKTPDLLEHLQPHLNKRGEKTFNTAELPVFEEIIAYANASKSVASTSKALFVILGGWNSCSMGGFFDSGAEFLKAELKRGVSYRFIASCYAKLDDAVYYISSENVTDLIATTPQKFSATVNYKAEFTATKNIYALGHSYGGWLAMNLARYLPHSAMLKGLVTLDPISKINCTPTQLFGSYMRSQLEPWPHAGCVEAPSDFTASERASISSRAGFWQNFYQNASVYLHSSNIVGAKNYFVYYDFTSIFEIFDAHRTIDSDVRVWNNFAPLIRAG